MQKKFICHISKETGRRLRELFIERELPYTICIEKDVTYLETEMDLEYVKKTVERAECERRTREQNFTVMTKREHDSSMLYTLISRRHGDKGVIVTDYTAFVEEVTQ